jgi:hypothetical protein
VPEPTLAPVPSRPELRHRLRTRLPEILPGLRFAAEGLLGAEAPIDLVAVEPSGRAVLLLVGDAGEDLELVGRALAQRAWVEARLGDWLQLAPHLGIRPQAGARVVLLCPAFRPETLAAVRSLGPDGPSLVAYRCIRNGGEVAVLLEPLANSTAPRASDSLATGGSAHFRSGLSEADLGLTAEECAEFD